MGSIFVGGRMVQGRAEIALAWQPWTRLQNAHWEGSFVPTWPVQLETEETFELRLATGERWRIAMTHVREGRVNFVGFGVVPAQIMAPAEAFVPRV